ncbi:uncharacterized protein LOC124366705 [Homalodisca vitripennis]|uniref:uncharacterized protein LOC124366705 n=1 Tax=Homalodisca vitripennis TaxID=197043 RepID=UPI001EEA663B|nr:uncharacterized protein LOC124366705 [Homalodisca vitripennis]
MWITTLKFSKQNQEKYFLYISVTHHVLPRVPGEQTLEILGPYPPPWNTAYNKPPPRQGSWGSASLNAPKGTLPYQSSKGPPPRFTPASRNPGIVSAPYPPPASFQTDLNRFGGNQADLRSQKRNKVQSNKCRAGESKVYKVGEKWTPEGSCGRHSCVDGGKIYLFWGRL